MVVYTPMHFILTVVILLINFALATAFMYYSMGLPIAALYAVVTLIATYLIGRGVDIDDEEE